MIAESNYFRRFVPLYKRYVTALQNTKCCRFVTILYLHDRHSVKRDFPTAFVLYKWSNYRKSLISIMCVCFHYPRRVFLFVDFQDNEARRKMRNWTSMKYRANEINASYQTMKGDYRALDDSGLFLVSSMIIYVRGARHDQQSILRTIPPLTFFLRYPDVCYP